MDSTPWFSELVVGTMRWGKWGAQYSTAQYEEAIAAALELELTTFDHADIYGDYTTEAEFGAALKLHPEWREQMEIVTKCGILQVSANRSHHYIKAYDSSKQHIIASAEQSLKNLETDYLDVLLLHRPDVLMDPDEVGEAFTSLYESGKVRSFGVSNFTPSQLSMLQSTFPIVTHQVEISLKQVGAFDNGILDQCSKDSIIPMAWSPLGGGTLPSGVQEELERWAAHFETTPQVVALAWLMQHPAGIVPVLGTTKVENMRKATEALSIKLDRQQWYSLYQAATGKRLP